MELREQALKPPGFMTPLPSYKKLFAYLLAFSFLAGFVLRLHSMNAAEALVFGGAEGIFLLALPALFASVFAASVLSRKHFRRSLKYYLSIGLVGAIANAISFAAAIYLLGASTQAAQFAILLANAVVFITWFIALSILLSARPRNALLLSVAQPLLSLAFIVLWRKLSLVETALPQASFFFLVPKLALASLAMLAVLAGMAYLLNAPARRNFGVSATQAASLFFSQWLEGNKGLERVLDEMGEDIVTTIAVAEFRDPRGRRKAVFLVPNVHFGPFGNIGGSEFPAILSDKLGRKLACEAFVFHGTVYHDFNPVSSASASQLEKALLRLTENSKAFSKTASLLRVSSGMARIGGFAFGKDAFLALSPPPFPSGDVDFASGYAISLRAGQQLGGEVALADTHAAEERMRKWNVGSREFHEFMQAAGKLKQGAGGQQKQFKLGVASDRLDGFTSVNGIGKAGLKVAVFEINGRRHAMALFDANNTLPPLREKMVASLKREYGFDYAAVFTTDTHAVNTLDNVHNPLGRNVDEKLLLEKLLQTAGRAVGDLEQCSGRVCTALYPTRVLGSGKAGELASTINAIVAMARAAAPAVFIISLALALLALLLA